MPIVNVSLMPSMMQEKTAVGKAVLRQTRIILCAKYYLTEFGFSDKLKGMGRWVGYLRHRNWELWRLRTTAQSD